MSKLKYVVDELDGFAIFPEYVNHDDIGQKLIRFEIIDNEVRCHGKSVSLRMDSRGAIDAEVIAKKLDLSF